MKNKAEAAAKLNELAAASQGFRKIVQNGRSKGAQPLVELYNNKFINNCGVCPLFIKGL